MRKCNYRKCGADISHKRIDAKYCSTSHRKMEQTYLKRRAKLIEKYKEKGLKQVESIKLLKSVIEGK